MNRMRARKLSDLHGEIPANYSIRVLNLGLCYTFPNSKCAYMWEFGRLIREGRNMTNGC